MSRSGPLIAVWALVMGVGPAPGQPDPEPKDGKVTYLLTLSAAPTPTPANRYHLLPEYRDLMPGEKLSGFLKCFMEQDNFFNAENSRRRNEWTQLPLDLLPADVREKAGIKNGLAYNPKYATLMVFMDQAARYNRVEWNEYHNLRHDGINMLLPEVQKLRALASVLQLRMRGEIKNGEFDRAIVTAQTLFGLAQMFEQHPTMIGSLIGIAVSFIAINGLEEMVGQPGAPNLYWALSDLPTPVMNLRAAVAGERLFISATFADVLNPRRALSEAELDAELRRLEEILTGTGEKAVSRLRARFTAFAADATRVEAARKRLAESGMAAELVKNLLPIHVAILEDFHRYEVLREEEFKWLNLPFPVAQEGIREAEERVARSKTDLVFAAAFLPSTSRVKAAQARLDQRIAYLRVIEAVRLHAHENGGKLPASLDEIRLPIPLDPVSGKPFEYRVADGVATLHGANSTPEDERTNRFYEIRLRK